MNPSKQCSRNARLERERIRPSESFRVSVARAIMAVKANERKNI
jgi:hypothetical protein